MVILTALNLIFIVSILLFSYSTQRTEGLIAALILLTPIVAILFNSQVNKKFILKINLSYLLLSFTLVFYLFDTLNLFYYFLILCLSSFVVLKSLSVNLVIRFFLLLSIIGLGLFCVYSFSNFSDNFTINYYKASCILAVIFPIIFNLFKIKDTTSFEIGIKLYHCFIRMFFLYTIYSTSPLIELSFSNSLAMSLLITSFIFVIVSYFSRNSAHCINLNESVVSYIIIYFVTIMVSNNFYQLALLIGLVNISSFVNLPKDKSIINSLSMQQTFRGMGSFLVIISITWLMALKSNIAGAQSLILISIFCLLFGAYLITDKKEFNEKCEMKTLSISCLNLIAVVIIISLGVNNV